MKCSKCEKESVYESTNQKLCKEHYFDYFENKVFRTINKYKLYDQNDNICVATSGGKDSMAILYLTMLYCRKHRINFFSLAIDEGIKGYRDESLDSLKEFCEKNKIQLEIYSFKDKYGATMDQLREKGLKDLKKKPCTVCGILRRTLINRLAREMGATKLVTGHNMDDEAQTVLMNLFKGNMGHNAPLGPIVGLSDNNKFVKRVKPLYHVLDKETALYTKMKGFKLCYCHCPHSDMSFRRFVKGKLNEIEDKHPGCKNGIVNSLLEILPVLKEQYKNKKEFRYCEICGDACSGKICNACKMEEELCLNLKKNAT
jgi:uncharacterized protein (TIGR00269 family)